MVAHSGFITVARKVDADWHGRPGDALVDRATVGNDTADVDNLDREGFDRHA
jgi:hypothetical protein